MATNTKTESGRCNFVDEQGNLCLAISYKDSKGVVTTEVEVVTLFVEPEIVISE